MIKTLKAKKVRRKYCDNIGGGKKKKKKTSDPVSQLNQLK